MGKNFQKEEELFSKLVFNILKKYRVLFCVSWIYLLPVYFFQKDKVEMIRISKIIICHPHLHANVNG